MVQTPQHEVVTTKWQLTAIATSWQRPISERKLDVVKRRIRGRTLIYIQDVRSASDRVPISLPKRLIETQAIIEFAKQLQQADLRQGELEDAQN